MARINLGRVKGDDGVGLEYKWDGSKLGIRREGEHYYSYSDLKADVTDEQLESIVKTVYEQIITEVNKKAAAEHKHSIDDIDSLKATLYSMQQSISSAGEVKSVNGLKGDVVLDADSIEHSPGWSVRQELNRKASSFHEHEDYATKDELNAIPSPKNYDTDIADIWQAVNNKAFTSHKHTAESVYINSSGDTLDKIAAKHIDYDGWDTVADKLNSLQSQISNIDVPEGVDLSPLETQIKELQGAIENINYPVKSVNNKTGDITLNTDDVIEGRYNKYVSNDEKLSWNMVQFKADKSKVNEQFKEIEEQLQQLSSSSSDYVIPRVAAEHKENEIHIHQEYKPVFDIFVKSIHSDIKQLDNKFTFEKGDGYMNLELEIEEGEGDITLNFANAGGYFSYTVFKVDGERIESGWLKVEDSFTHAIEKGDRIRVNTNNDLVFSYDKPAVKPYKKLYFEGIAINEDYDDTELLGEIATVKRDLNYKANEKHTHTASEIEGLESLVAAGYSLPSAKKRGQIFTLLSDEGDKTYVCHRNSNGQLVWVDMLATFI